MPAIYIIMALSRSATTPKCMAARSAIEKSSQIFTGRGFHPKKSKRFLKIVVSNAQMSVL
jgi:hypothetical protein